MPPPKKEPPTTAEIVQAQQVAASDGIDYYELPKALVQRIAKSSIPENAKLQKETVTALQKGSTVFINFLGACSVADCITEGLIAGLAATAHDIATSRQHKSISASDVLKALEVIQFGDMVEPLQHELQIFRENAKNPKKSASKSGSVSGTGDSPSARSKPSSSSTKGKGKERATDSALGPSPLSASVSAADVDKVPGAESAEEDEVEAGEDEEDELVDDVDIDEEPEDVVDQMAVDEGEVRHDVKATDNTSVNGAE